MLLIEVVSNWFGLPKFRNMMRLLGVIVVLTDLPSEIIAQEHAQNLSNSRMHANSQMAFYGDWTNTGLFADNKGTASFYGSRLQNIYGTSAIDFENLLLANGNSLDLHIPVKLKYRMIFQTGLVRTPRTDPSVSLIFGQDATHQNASNGRQVDGYASKIGRDSFSFPIGDYWFLRPVALAANANDNADMKAAYFFGDPTGATLPTGAPFPIGSRDLRVLTVSNVEYWDVDGADETQITLTWNPRSRVDLLTDSDLPRIGVVGWNGSEWISLGNTGFIGTFAEGKVQSELVVPNRFKAYALAKVSNNTRCVSNAPALKLSRNLVICPNEPALLDATMVGYNFRNYLWSDGSTRNTFVATKAGKYWVTVWDSCGNPQTDTINIRQLQAIKFAVDSISCYGTNSGQIRIQTDTARMSIYLNTRPVYTTQLGNLAAGTYRLEINKADYCNLDTLITITTPPQKSLRIYANPANPKVGETVLLTASPENGYKPLTYQWTPPASVSCATCQSTTATLVDKSIHTYTVIAVDKNGCIATDEIVFNTGSTRKYSIYVPNIFKPDQEGYTALGNPNHVKVRTMRIFDRWGELVFEARDFKPDGSVTWDGSFRGKPLNMGTYVVVIEAEFIDGTVQKIARDLLLVR